MFPTVEKLWGGHPACPHSLTIHGARLTPEITVKVSTQQVVHAGTLLPLPQGPQVPRYSTMDHR